MEQSTVPVRPREAASVILLQRPHLVYMTARSATLRVAPGFYVFPGGRVDPGDREWAAAAWDARANAEFGAEDENFGPFVAAAVREVFEEVGLLLARDGDGRPLWQPPAASDWRDALQEARDGLNRGRIDLSDVLSRYGWRVAHDRLAYVSRWVTPPAARRRFDTRFFVADVTDCIEPIPSPAEVAEAEWVPLLEALAREERGTLPLMRPTRSILHTLARLRDTEAIMNYFRRPDAQRMEVLERNTPEVLQAVLASLGVTVIPVPSPTLLPAAATNVYFIVSGGEALLVDAGDGGEEGVELVASRWERAGRPRVHALVLTHDHPDHAGGVAALARRIRCPVAVHRQAAERVRDRFGFTPDIVLDGGEHFLVGRRRLDVIHAPGHASDHVVLHDEEGGILYSGDNVVGEGSTWVGPPDGDMTDYMASLERMAQLRVHVIAPGHGPLLDDGPRRIQALMERRRIREEQIVDLLAEAPRTVDELFALLYEGAVPTGVEEMARRTVLGHLHKLEREGRVQVDDGNLHYSLYKLTSKGIRP